MAIFFGEKFFTDDFALNTTERDEKIIVSLTSFPARIDTVGYAIKSLFNQTVKPDKIILWLATEQFKNTALPELLEQLKLKGLEIRFCEDLKSHKKYYYSLKEQKQNELVITYDDDIIYPENSIEKLLKYHKKFPNAIITNRAQKATSLNGKFTPYNTWKVWTSYGVKKPSHELFPSTGGGTLYPFGAINQEAFNISTLTENAFSVDDLWMRFMSALNKTPIVKTAKNHRTFTVTENSQTESLQVQNCIGGENDVVLEKLSTLYPNAVKTILGDID